MSLHAEDGGIFSTLLYFTVFDDIRGQETVSQPDTFIKYLQFTTSFMTVT
jgi:hypothetical protein